MRSAEINPDTLAAYRARNRVHSAVLVLGVLAIVVTAASLLFGPIALPWVIAAALLAWWMTPQLSHLALLRALGARPLAPDSVPQLYRALGVLAQRAELSDIPVLFHLPDAQPNAFTLGQQSGTAIVLSDGLLRIMQLDELVAILAHEVAHVRHADLRVMSLVDAVARTTESLAFLATVLLVLNVPLFLAGEPTLPWLGLALLASAPTLCALLQLALSRTREYAADLEAVRIFGHTDALIRALRKLERAQRSLISRIFGARQHGGESSLLRTHPATAERIRRLEALVARPDVYAAFEMGDEPLSLPALPRVRRRLF